MYLSQQHLFVRTLKESSPGFDFLFAVYIQKLQMFIVKLLPEYDFYLIICILDQLIRNNKQLYRGLIKRNIKPGLSYFISADFGG